MLKLNGRKVLQARFHEIIFARGLGQLEPEITVGVTAKAKDAEMVKTEDGLYIKIHSQTEKRFVEIFVPSANIKNMVFYPEDKT